MTSTLPSPSLSRAAIGSGPKAENEDFTSWVSMLPWVAPLLPKKTRLQGLIRLWLSATPSGNAISVPIHVDKLVF